MDPGVVRVITMNPNDHDDQNDRSDRDDGELGDDEERARVTQGRQ